MIYGYARISTKKQSIERQVRNIKAAYPSAVVFREEYTGTELDGREVFNKLLKLVTEGDTIVFDSVSRMSRNAAEGVSVYMELYERGVELVFLKEPHINTAVYKDTLSRAVPLTGSAVDCILNGINEYMKILASEQIRLAFDQAEKEVQDLKQRTREGLVTARLNGKHLGQTEGRKLTVKKAAPAKEKIKKLSKRFGGQNTDAETMMLAKISKATFYKYVRELEMEGGEL